MKVILEEKEEEGLASLLGKNVTLFCGVYIYTGKLVGISETCVKLSDARVVYETGSFETDTFKDAQSINQGGCWYVTTQSIESFGLLKKS